MAPRAAAGRMGSWTTGAALTSRGPHDIDRRAGAATHEVERRSDNENTRGREHRGGDASAKPLKAVRAGRADDRSSETGAILTAPGSWSAPLVEALEACDVTVRPRVRSPPLKAQAPARRVARAHAIVSGGATAHTAKVARRLGHVAVAFGMALVAFVAGDMHPASASCAAPRLQVEPVRLAHLGKWCTSGARVGWPSAVTRGLAKSVAIALRRSPLHQRTASPCRSNRASALSCS